MKNDALARFIYAYLAVYIAVSAFTAPCPATSVMLTRDGFWGYAVTAGTAVLALVVAADVAINDWLPERYIFYWAQARRHWLYAVAAACYVTPLFAASAYFVNAAQVFFYVGMALFGLVLGYRETQAKRGITCAD
ncbi:hypothetical protein [Paraburkholderia phytofirmans]|uniref:Transmembrane protein n=1 Tax=Paraburkholderia phytofirmans (strain DSM 17436 / LMG 22146 / PsJN) TaxID=398527 RepID=B2T1Z1_PARPJ|nr:hypothetical protein [Paraburkholderia phytofirmans]ACD15602.1 hypothetical protein Bphyt_1186 [Paraburkholderia phytofirmans PsJN]